MFSVIDLYNLKRHQKLNQDEIEICSMIANRFTDGDLFKAFCKLDAYKRKDRMFPSAEVKDFIVEICHEKNITL